MTIEQTTFGKYIIDKDKLTEYGFTRDGEKLVFSKILDKDDMKIVLEYDGAICGRIIDLAVGGEYTNFRIENAQGYAAGIRQKFIDLLSDVRGKCCRDARYRLEQSRRICDFIYRTYGILPEFLWQKFPYFGAFRKKDCKKWFALMGEVNRVRIDGKVGETEILNVRTDAEKINEMLSVKGYYPAYHMNKKSWITVVLDDTLSDAEIQDLIRKSYKSL